MASSSNGASNLVDEFEESFQVSGHKSHHNLKKHVYDKNEILNNKFRIVSMH